MQTKIQKWGNSLGLRIPKSLATEAEVEAGSTVHLSIADGKLVIKPLRRRRYALRDLLKAINAKNVHGEIETGDRVGREVW